MGFVTSVDDWNLLAGLLGAGGGSFEHRMGLRRAEAHAFYAASGEAVQIRAEKAAILNGENGGRYLLTCAAGLPAATEFARLFAPDEHSGVGEGDVQGEAFARGLTLRVEPDLLFLKPPGWELVWASVCFPTRWSLEGKRGQPLTEIHAVVPTLNEELGHKIAVFFERLPAGGGGWGRANWGLCACAARNQHPDLQPPLPPLAADWPVNGTFVRIESQHFCKLPTTGAIAFGIRILHFSVAEVVARDTALVAALREQLRTMPPAVAAYKGIPAGWWEQLK